MPRAIPISKPSKALSGSFDSIEKGMNVKAGLKMVIAAAALGLAMAPAQAAPDNKPGSGNPKLTSSCVSVALSSGGCLFSGNDSDIYLVQSIYNEAGKPGGPILLDPIAKFEGGDGKLSLPGFGTVTGLGGAFGTFDFGQDWLVEFVSVKAGNGFLLYRLDTSTGAGSWTTKVPGLNGKDLSHITFFGRPTPSLPGYGGTPGVGAVPEPGTWAMLIAGFGLVGLALRRRKGATTAA
jgi:hypothetical protein